MVAKTFSATHSGVQAQLVQIEAVREEALPAIQITGLPGDVIKESKDRVRGCLIGLGFQIPTARVVVHLSPAGIKKQGSQLDLAIALAVLAAEQVLDEKTIRSSCFFGELSLDGRIQPVPGAIALVEAALANPGVESAFVPAGNPEVALLNSNKVRKVHSLPELMDFLRGKGALLLPMAPVAEFQGPDFSGPTLDDVRGHRLAKRALEVALAGEHHLLLMGPPGVGKSLLAACARGLLPAPSTAEWVDILKTHGHATDQLPQPFTRPFRSPHHSISAGAFLGGGSGTVVPGEVTLAHHGILFLDELPEFRRDVLEGLRTPLENGEIHLHRVHAAINLPARFSLIAAMNPCPCGFTMDQKRRCLCGPDKARKYQQRVSGPILDRIDLLAVLTRSDGATENPHSNEKTRANIKRVHDQRGTPRPYSGSARDLLVKLRANGSHLSHRGIASIQRLAATIAALEDSPTIQTAHLEEAQQLKCPSSIEYFPG